MVTFLGNTGSKKTKKGRHAAKKEKIMLKSRPIDESPFQRSGIRSSQQSYDSALGRSFGKSMNVCTYNTEVE